MFCSLPFGEMRILKEGLPQRFSQSRAAAQQLMLDIFAAVP
jgi:hypothetical protein